MECTSVFCIIFSPKKMSFVSYSVHQYYLQIKGGKINKIAGESKDTVWKSTLNYKSTVALILLVVYLKLLVCVTTWSLLLVLGGRVKGSP